MQSHTVPRKLLEQFAYDDADTKSKRLWRYEKDRPAFKKASPATATCIDHHFSHPDDATKEAEIERRLNQEFEDPVNNFLFEITNPGFVPTDERRRQLTFYVTLLFQRSRARREGSTHTQQMFEHALELFIQNESQVLTLAAKYFLESGVFYTPSLVVKRARALCAPQLKEKNTQKGYIGSLQHMMSTPDKALFQGEWKCIRTVPTDPFIISDAPVVTWRRKHDGTLSYGVGFQTPDVEVILPISPLVCLHIHPDVKRSVAGRKPTVLEVNTAQAAFATQHCFSNIQSAEIDRVFQENVGKAKIGVNCFTISHRNFDTAVYDFLMDAKPIASL